MSDTDVDLLPDDGDIAAAEYVIGLLTRDEALALEMRAVTDPSIARSIRQWQGWLSDLALTLKPVTPPPHVWQRLETAIMPAGAPAMDLAPYEQLQPQPKPRRRRPRRQWNVGSWSSWRSGLIGAALAASVFGAYLGFSYWKGDSTTQVAAVISLDGKKADYKVEVTPDGYASVVAVDPNLPNDAALQFWTLDGATPVSLGLLPPKGRFKLKRQLVPGAKLLISKEPEGGSPAAGPTGPIVYQGNLIKG